MAASLLTFMNRARESEESQGSADSTRIRKESFLLEEVSKNNS